MTPTQRKITLGKRRGLAQCADEHGVFGILALDHRQVIHDAFKTAADPYAEGVEFKREVIRALAPVSTAVLLDPSLGAGPAAADSSFPGGCGMVVALEESGYANFPSDRFSRVAEGWSAAKIRRMGAQAVKLLVYYHPGSKHASAMRDLVRKVAADCCEQDIAFFLEPMSYSIDPDRPKMGNAERTEAILQTVRDLSPLGADVLKLEFPVFVDEDRDEQRWMLACEEVNRACSIPWVLLSAAVEYEVFASEAEICCRAGASGILAGRAIWKDALKLFGLERRMFLMTTAVERMRHLRTICSAHARPYLDSLAPLPLEENWYKQY